MKKPQNMDKPVIYYTILKRLRAWEDEYITNKHGFQSNALINIIKLNKQLQELREICSRLEQ